jgi:uncharacterized protein YcbK (DUF882 family)
MPAVRDHRRRRLVAAAAALIAAPMLALPRRSCAGVAPKALSFVHTHTGEALTIEYAREGEYIAAALARIDWLLRDFRTADVAPIDPALLDQLHALATITGTHAAYQVISGYRSLATNETLRRRGSGGVAAHSLHLEGRAIDVRLADIALAELRDAAISMRAGGVGFYPQSQFVHLDTGGVRRW